jgi:hypothetical protein
VATRGQNECERTAFYLAQKYQAVKCVWVDETGLAPCSTLGFGIISHASLGSNRISEVVTFFMATFYMPLQSINVSLCQTSH